MMTRNRGGLRVRLRSPVVSAKAYGHAGAVIHSEPRGDECMDIAGGTLADVATVLIRITDRQGR